MVACEKTESAIVAGFTVKSESLSEEEERGGRTRRDPRTESFTACNSTEILKWAIGGGISLWCTAMEFVKDASGGM